MLILLPLLILLFSSLLFTAQEVSSLLKKELDFDHDNEVSMFIIDDIDNANNFMAIDMANKGKKVAIEFDGPSHFIQFMTKSNEIGWKHNGKTRMKTRRQPKAFVLLGLGRAEEILSQTFLPAPRGSLRRERSLRWEGSVLPTSPR